MMIRMQLKNFLEKDLGHTVVAQGNDGNEAVALYRQHQPDFVTIDLTMPNKDGSEAIREIIAEFPAARIIVCSAIKDAAKITETLQAGARAFIKKPLQFNLPDYAATVKADIAEALED
jgi:two-component system chemotaxis response regulator CheY